MWTGWTLLLNTIQAWKSTEGESVVYKRLIGQSTEREGCDEAMVISYMTIYEAEDSFSTFTTLPHNNKHTNTFKQQKKPFCLGQTKYQHLLRIHCWCFSRGREAGRWCVRVQYRIPIISPFPHYSLIFRRSSKKCLWGNWSSWLHWSYLVLIERIIAKYIRWKSTKTGTRVQRIFGWINFIVFFSNLVW